MHENFRYYETCKRRQRNNGLFLADQVNLSLCMLAIVSSYNRVNVIIIPITKQALFKQFSYMVFIIRNQSQGLVLKVF